MSAQAFFSSSTLHLMNSVMSGWSTSKTTIFAARRVFPPDLMTPAEASAAFMNDTGPEAVPPPASCSFEEQLAGGGTASGPVSFMKAADASAGVIKSGGKTRRAAKMVVLDVDHPDIVDFIRCKAEEERKAWALIAAGYDASLDGSAYGSIFFQNANNSVRVTDDFMRAALEGRPWSTRYVTNGAVAETRPARDLLRLIAEATWQCGDPGMQFDTTINDWHTCPNRSEERRVGKECSLTCRSRW